MDISSSRTPFQNAMQGSHFGPALGAYVAIEMLKKQLDATKVQGAAALSLIESANPNRPSPSFDGRVGTRFAEWA